LLQNTQKDKYMLRGQNVDMGKNSVFMVIIEKDNNCKLFLTL